MNTNFNSGEFITRSSGLLDILKNAEKVAKTDATVLILGETGTGKDLLARWIHNNSRRKNMPFVSLNCAAVPETLMESELFGHAKGAFTDASFEKPGLVEDAQGGTLFLDEIGDLSLSAQPKLLQLLEIKEFRRLGENKKRKANVRLICATNQNLDMLVEEKKFRKDLYWRIKEIVFLLSPIRERKEDLLPLTKHFIELFSKELHKKVKGISDAALSFLQKHDFPGNVRELRNIIKQAMVLVDGEKIWLEHLPVDVRLKTKESAEPSTAERPFKPLQEMEKKHITEALILSKGNKKLASQLLGIPRSTLYKKLKEHKINVSI